MKNFLYDIHTKHKMLHENLTLEEVIEKTGLTKSVITYRSTHPNHGEEIMIDRKDLRGEKSEKGMQSTFTPKQLRDWDDVYKAAEMIRNGTGIIKKVMVNGKTELRTVPK